MAKLDVKALGLSLGITWSGCVLLMGLICTFTGWGCSFLNAIGRFYIGYNSTVLGSVVGAFWAFFDMGIGGIVIALLYNKFSK